MKTVLAGHAYDLQTKFEKLTSDRYDLLSIPNYVIKKGPFQRARHGNRKRQRIYHAAHVSLKKAEKKVYTSIVDRFLNSPRNQKSTSDGPKNTAHAWTRLRPKTTPKIATAPERTQQFRPERLHESLRRLPRSQKIQRATISRVWQS